MNFTVQLGTLLVLDSMYYVVSIFMAYFYIKLNLIIKSFFVFAVFHNKHNLSHVRFFVNLITLTLKICSNGLD